MEVHEKRDASSLRAISAPNCDTCLKTIENFEMLWKDNTRLEGPIGQFRPTSVKCTDALPCDVVGTMDMPAHREIAGDGTVTNIPAESYELTVSVSNANGKWQLNGWARND